jgi:hypothetical protein
MSTLQRKAAACNVHWNADGAFCPRAIRSDQWVEGRMVSDCDGSMGYWLRSGKWLQSDDQGVWDVVLRGAGIPVGWAGTI